MRGCVDMLKQQSLLCSKRWTYVYKSSELVIGLRTSNKRVSSKAVSSSTLKISNHCILLTRILLAAGSSPLRHSARIKPVYKVYKVESL